MQVSLWAALPGFPSGDEGETQIGTRAGTGFGERRSEVLRIIPIAWGLFFSNPFPSFPGWGWEIHGFAGMGPNPWPCDPFTRLLTVGLLAFSAAP